jgi:hypothetical protein
MTSHHLASCQAMISIEDSESFAEDVQLHIGRLPNEALKQATVGLKAHLDAVAALFALHVGELDERALPVTDHLISTTQWLEKHCSMSATEASGVLVTGRALPKMPIVANNALSGRVSWQSVRVLSQARDRYPKEFKGHEEVFAGIATYLSVKDLKRAAGHWEQQVNYDQALLDAKRLETQRSLYHSQTLDGLWSMKGTFTPEGGHTIEQAIDAITDPTNIDPVELRSPTQRRADALVDICSFYLTHTTNLVTSGGERPHVTVTLDYETLKGHVQRLPEIDGTPVTPQTIRRITCDAGIIPMILGSDSEPLDVGRKTRTIPSALRRALEQRDQGCTWSGCTAPVSWCDTHHIIHWADGGNTSLNNTRLLCRKHHTATHTTERAPPEP